MALWSNTSDGWGSDAGKSGNGQLGTYLQSSTASAPTSPSEKQAGDVSNSMPTSSVSRMALAAPTPAPAVMGGVLARGAQYSGQDTVTSALAPNSVSVVNPIQYAKPVSNDLSPDYNYRKNVDTYADPTKMAQPEFTGPKFLKVTGSGQQNNNISYLAWDPNLKGYSEVGNSVWFGNGYQTQFNPGYANQNYQDAGQVTGDRANQGTAGAMAYANETNQDAVLKYRTDYNANFGAERLKNLTSKYNQELYETGQLVPSQGLSLDDTDSKARASALSTYAANQQSADAFKAGVQDVDTSQQDAINQSSIAALASRYSTNIAKGNVGSMGRLYASALSSQSGVNSQLSDEAYATGFNRNLSNFNQAVQNQATIDTNATGVKLQSDITAMGDVVAKLQQQVKQIGTSSGNQINTQLLDLQEKINDYKAAASKYGADTDEIIKWGKALVGAAVGITAIALAPVSGGASIAGGIAAGAAIAKA